LASGDFTAAINQAVIKAKSIGFIFVTIQLDFHKIMPTVIPATAGIQCYLGKYLRNLLDPRLRGDDGKMG
jgi:hypothetical protein